MTVQFIDLPTQVAVLPRFCVCAGARTVRTVWSQDGAPAHDAPCPHCVRGIRVALVPFRQDTPRAAA